jgi:hypothetical protein
MAKLLVSIKIENEDLHVSPPEIFSIDRNALGPVASNASELHANIVRALDLQITG